MTSIGKKQPSFLDERPQLVKKQPSFLNERPRLVKKQCIIRQAPMGSASRGRILIKKMLCCVFIVLAFERNTGVEPAFQAWEARALPMC